jgi:putative NADH-flavin reductase
MKKVLILGANGQIARVALELFLRNTDCDLTLYARKAARLRDCASKSDRIHVIEGDVLDIKKLESIMAGHDVVYANLDGKLEEQAKNIVVAMNRAGIKRLIFVSSMGIYDEVPGETHKAVLDPYRNSAAIIEASNLDYTIIRPEWLNDQAEIDYETTQKDEAFKNPKETVSRMSVADLIVKLATTPNLEVRHSLGVNKR